MTVSYELKGILSEHCKRIRKYKKALRKLRIKQKHLEEKWIEQETELTSLLNNTNYESGHKRSFVSVIIILADINPDSEILDIVTNSQNESDSEKELFANERISVSSRFSEEMNVGQASRPILDEVPIISSQSNIHEKTVLHKKSPTILPRTTWNVDRSTFPGRANLLDQSVFAPTGKQSFSSHTTNQISTPTNRPDVCADIPIISLSSKKGHCAERTTQNTCPSRENAMKKLVNEKRRNVRYRPELHHHKMVQRTESVTPQVEDSHATRISADQTQPPILVSESKQVLPTGNPSIPCSPPEMWDLRFSVTDAS